MSRSPPVPAPRRAALIRAARERIAGDLDTLLLGRQEAALLAALSALARRSGGIGRVAKRAGVNRTFLYRMLSPTGNPEMRTIDAVLRTMGLRVAIRALHRGSDRGRGRKGRAPNGATERRVAIRGLHRGRGRGRMGRPPNGATARATDQAEAERRPKPARKRPARPRPAKRRR